MFKDDPMIYHDDGYGVTEDSLKFFEGLKGKLGELLDIRIDQNRQFTMEIQGTHTITLLSGTNCGYGGTGPHGSLKILEMLGVQVASDYILSNEHCHIDLRNRNIRY